MSDALEALTSASPSPRARGAADAAAPAPKSDDARPDSRGNSTILIGANLLRVAAQFNGPTSLTNLSHASGMSPSRTYRYLRGLCESGLMEQNRRSGLYDLGPQLLHLGLAAISRLDAARQAVSALPELTAKTQLVSVVTVWGSHGPTAIACEQGRLPAPIRIREGVTVSTFQTAAGKVFLAYLAPEFTRDVVAGEIAARRGQPDADQFTWEKVETIKADVRRNGLARASGTQNPAYSSLAAPVFDRNGALKLTISLMGAKGSFDVAWGGAPAIALKACAADLSARLGAGAPASIEF